MTTTEPNIENAAPADTPIDPNSITMSINGKSVAARKGELIIAAADRSGDYIPRFCYHPRMSAVGMCRQCLVEVETADEQKAAVIAGVGFGVVALAAFVAGIAMDPMNGY